MFAKNAHIALPLMPALLFVVFAFLLPILWFLSQATNGSPVVSVIPATAEAIAGWDGVGLPQDDVFEALVRDLTQAEPADVASLARELNFRQAGNRRLILQAARELEADLGGEARARLEAINGAWASPEIWRVIRQSARTFTTYNILESLDLEAGPDGGVSVKPVDDRLFLGVYARTLTISLTVTVICVLLGYPLAYAVANAPARTAAILMLLVLLPFWTSLLVRTLAWMVIFQRQGILNGVLIEAGLMSEGLQFLRTRFAVIVSMTHIMLPFVVLPLISVMKKIPPNYMNAAESLGAGRIRALVSVYLPLTLPGLSAGVVLVMTLSLGFYVTPMLLGGGGDQMISNLVATFVNRSLNWGLAAALGLWLIVFAMAFIAVVGGTLSSKKWAVS
ncbi:ABC transporter permease [Oceaniradius stylonematis]|uniref:ABC transporter permease n=1 Tax=Oceaniradius stylonematis TaxID=2184161 RepID=UPI00273DE6D1|nr:ABC transporter permease [Oceaniradius stylonematis]